MYLNGTSLFNRKIYKKIGCFEMLSRDIKNGYWHKLVFITYEKAKLRI